MATVIRNIKRLGTFSIGEVLTTVGIVWLIVISPALAQIPS